MATVIVKSDEGLESALKRFKKISAFKKRELKKRVHWMSKREKRLYKSKLRKF